MTAKRKTKTKRQRRRQKRRMLFVKVFLGILFLGLLTLGGLYLYRQGDFFAAAKMPQNGNGGASAQVESVEGSGAGPAGDSSETEEPEGTGSGGADAGAEEKEPSRYADLLADPEYMEAYRIYQKDTNQEDEVTLLFAGDILFAESYAPIGRIRARAGGIADSFSPEALEFMLNADIFMVNNEFPYSNGGSPTPDKQYTFRAKPESADMLYEMGVDIVSLANNHAYDYGESAFLDTLDTLENIKMPYVGGGRNLTEALRPVYFIANDLKIAYVSATQIERLDTPDTKGATETTPGTCRSWKKEELERVLAVIKEAKENSDFVVVYMHWGTENVDQPDWAQKEQAPLLAQAGADLIIGDHPHCLQGITYEGEVPVFYSLGNYLFNSRDLDTCLVQAAIDANGLKSLRFIPGRQQNCSVFLHSGSEKERVLSYMRSLSPGVAIDGEGYITKQ